MKLKELSYMDEKIYIDCKIDLDSENQEQLFYQLCEFYELHELTRQWHKNDYYETIKIEKTQLCIQKLRRYYINCYFDASKHQLIRLSAKQEDNLSLETKALYLKELRIHDDLNNPSLRNLLILNPFLQRMMTISRIVSKIKVVVVNKKLPKNIPDKPIIFVLSHVGKNDQVVFNEAIKKHYTILSGDYENLHNNIEGLVTRKNGVIFFDMNSQTERKEVVNKVADKLKEGDNILCSMEGAWNISPNKIVTKLFPGMVVAAQKADAIIIPVAIERFSSSLYSINVSNEFFYPSEYFKNTVFNKTTANIYAEEIRQNLADLKFATYYSKKIYDKILARRSLIGDYDTYNENFKKEILEEWNFDEDDIQRKKFCDVSDPNYAYEYVITYFENKYNLMEMLSSEEITEFFVEINNELKNPVYPNEVKKELYHILNQAINYKSRKKR